MKKPIKKPIILAFFSVLIILICFFKLHAGALPEFSGPSIWSLSSLEKLLKDANILEYTYQVVDTVPHNRQNFTEGLQFENHYFYESTGLNGESSLQKIDGKTGKLLKIYKLPLQFFAEGMTTLGDKLYQLTYHKQTAFVYDKNTFSILDYLHYNGEGWGLTTDGTQLIMSNGTAILNFRDPQTFQSTRTLLIKVQDKEIGSLNELEFIEGKIYANVWPTSIIILISPESGVVEGWFNIDALRPANCRPQVCVANGIAYDADNDLIYVTGKYWPSLYAIKLKQKLAPF